MALQGNLTDLPFEDLMGIISRNGKSGILTFSFEQNRFQADVIVREAHLFAAYLFRLNQYGKTICQSGEKVIFKLLDCKDAEFIFAPLPANFSLPETNIFRSNREILLAKIFQENSGSACEDEPAFAYSSNTASISGSTLTINQVSRSSSFGSGITYQNTQPDTVSRSSSFGSGITYQSTQPDTIVTQTVTPAPIPAFVPPARSKRGWISSLMDRLKGL